MERWILFVIIPLALLCFICAFGETAATRRYKRMGVFGRVSAWLSVACITVGLLMPLYIVTGPERRSGLLMPLGTVFMFLVVACVGFLLLANAFCHCPEEYQSECIFAMLRSGFGVAGKLLVFFVPQVWGLRSAEDDDDEDEEDEYEYEDAEEDEELPRGEFDQVLWSKCILLIPVCCGLLWVLFALVMVVQTVFAGDDPLGLAGRMPSEQASELPAFSEAVVDDPAENETSPEGALASNITSVVPLGDENTPQQIETPDASDVIETAHSHEWTNMEQYETDEDDEWDEDGELTEEPIEEGEAAGEAEQTPEQTDPVPAPPVNAGDYVIADSNSRELSFADLEGLTKDQLRLARNEIYARHGRTFKSSDLQTYFEGKSWYSANPGFSTDSISVTERKNITTISNYEKEMGFR